MKRWLIGFISFLAVIVLTGCNQEITGILNPKGVITYEERILLFDSLALMMIVVIPVIIMSFAFVFRYRASHKGGGYKPNWSHSVLLESFWWGIPCIIIVIMGIMSWKATHKLDPYRPIDGHTIAYNIQVVALPWKWLFIYPEQNIASVNELVLPKGKQVAFKLTSDNVPMSAFFVPQLGSQIYTMAGMQTQLHLLATATGTFRGINSQYNGAGFSDMHFPVHVLEEAAFLKWVARTQAASTSLDTPTYQKLRQPSIGDASIQYAPVLPKLFKSIIHSYMMAPSAQQPFESSLNTNQE